MRLIYLILAGTIALGMALTQHFALIYSWYWTYWWLDVVMHFSGGVVLTLIASAYLGSSVRVVALTVCIGLLWEVYEYVIGLSISEPNFISDTLIDLCMDTLGAVSVYGMMHVWEMYVLPSPEAHGVSPDRISS